MLILRVSSAGIIVSTGSAVTSGEAGATIIDQTDGDLRAHASSVSSAALCNQGNSLPGVTAVLQERASRHVGHTSTQTTFSPSRRRSNESRSMGKMLLFHRISLPPHRNPDKDPDRRFAVRARSRLRPLGLTRPTASTEECLFAVTKRRVWKLEEVEQMQFP